MCKKKIVFYKTFYFKKYLFLSVIFFLIFFIVSPNINQASACCYSDCGIGSSCNHPICVNCSNCTGTWNDTCSNGGPVYNPGDCCQPPPSGSITPTPTTGAGSNYCTDAGYHQCTVGSPSGSCTNGCTAYETYECNYNGQDYCGPPFSPNPQNCSAPCGITITPSISPPPGTCITGDACADCIFANRYHKDYPPNDIINFYAGNGWDTSCSNWLNIFNNWCTTGGASDCVGEKTKCGAACGIVPSPSPSPAASACAVAYQDCDKGLAGDSCTSACPDWVCDVSTGFSLDIFGYTFGSGKCVPAFLAPPCRPAQVSLQIEPSKDIREGTVVKFTVKKPDTKAIKKIIPVSNNFTPGLLDFPCFTGIIEGPAITDTFSCKALHPGQVIWIYNWFNCAPGPNNQGDCSHTSDPCSSIPKTFYINPLNAPVPGGLPCGDDPTNPNTTCATALGPFKVGDPRYFIKDLFTFILGLAGALGVLLIIYAGYLFMTSRGDKQRVQNAREVLVAAIAGLLFIILSVTILQVIGVDILQLPGFGT